MCRSGRFRVHGTRVYESPGLQGSSEVVFWKIKAMSVTVKKLLMRVFAREYGRYFRSAYIFILTAILYHICLAVRTVYIIHSVSTFTVVRFIVVIKKPLRKQ